MEKKKTKMENFVELRGLVQGNEELTKFIDHEIELLKTKASKRGTSKNDKANAEIMEIILEELNKIGTPVTISELMTQSDVISSYLVPVAEGEQPKHLSNQKISALMTKLIAQKLVVKTVEKKKSYFAVATVEGEEA